MSSTEDIGKWLERTREGMAAAKANGIIPTRVARDNDGSLIPPQFVFWVPWVPIALIAVIFGIIGFVDPVGEPAFLVALAATAAGGVAAAAPFLLHALKRAAIVSVIAFLVAGLMSQGASSVLFLGLLLWFLPARMYHRAAYDAEVIHRADNAAAWMGRGARVYVVLEVIDRVRTDGAKLRLDPAGGGVPCSRIVRALPADCAEGALLVLDGSGTCVESMPIDMHERFRHLEETA